MTTQAKAWRIGSGFQRAISFAILTYTCGSAAYHKRYQPYDLTLVLSCYSFVATVAATPMVKSHAVAVEDWQYDGLLKLLMPTLQTVSFFSLCLDLVLVSAATDQLVSLSIRGLVAMYADLGPLYLYIGADARTRRLAKFLWVVLPYRIMGLYGTLSLSTVAAFTAMAGICQVL